MTKINPQLLAKILEKKIEKPFAGPLRKYPTFSGPLIPQIPSNYLIISTHGRLLAIKDPPLFEVLLNAK